MNYQCGKCGRSFSCPEMLSFCPFCGTAYTSLFASHTVTQRIVIGSDAERTIQEKYWKKAQNEIESAIRTIGYSLPRFADERPGSEHWKQIPKEYDVDLLDIEDFITIRDVSSTAEFRTKLSRYLNALRHTFEIKKSILKKINAATQETVLQFGSDISSFEDEYSVQLDQEEQYIDSLCSDFAQAMGCERVRQLKPELKFDPQNDDWVGYPAEEDQDVWPNSLSEHEKLLQTLLETQDVLIKIVEENSTFILSVLRTKEDDPDEDPFIPSLYIPKLVKLAQEDYDPIFGQTPDKLLEVFSEAVAAFSSFVNNLPTYQDWIRRFPGENLPVFKQLLDEYKLNCLLRYLSDWKDNLLQELDRTYQERKLDMINVAQAMDQISEKYLTK